MNVLPTKATQLMDFFIIMVHLRELWLKNFHEALGAAFKSPPMSNSCHQSWNDVRLMFGRAFAEDNLITKTPSGCVYKPVTFTSYRIVHSYTIT
jgi:hypothetical protein